MYLQNTTTLVKININYCLERNIAVRKSICFNYHLNHSDSYVEYILDTIVLVLIGILLLLTN